MSDIIAQVGPSITALEQEFNIIAHNLANVSTVGYKRRRNEFSKVLSAQGLGGEEAIFGEFASNLIFDFSQGSIVETKRSLDFALDGKGFFVIETPGGPLYTRNGMFHVNQNGQIVDSNGRTVAGEQGPIAIPLNANISQLNVSKDGSITAGGVPVGKFKLIDFPEDQDALLPVGANCFWVPEDVKPDKAEDVVVRQGFGESSNVKMVEELVDMIMVSRLYESNLKFVSAIKETSSSIIGVAMA